MDSYGARTGGSRNPLRRPTVSMTASMTAGDPSSQSAPTMKAPSAPHRARSSRRVSAPTNPGTTTHTEPRNIVSVPYGYPARSGVNDSVTVTDSFAAITPPLGENVNGKREVFPWETASRISARQRWGNAVGFVSVSVVFLQSPGTASPQSTTSAGVTSSAGEIPSPRAAIRIVRSDVFSEMIS